MEAIPDMAVERERLNQIDGSMPRLNAIPHGCAFNPRCPKVFDRCRTDPPDLREVEPGRFVACHLFSPDKPAAGPTGVTIKNVTLQQGD